MTAVHPPAGHERFAAIALGASSGRVMIGRLGHRRVRHHRRDRQAPHYEPWREEILL